MLQVEQIAAQIREANCFLIGIGEAFAVGTKAEQSPLGKAYMENKKRLEGEAALLPAEREYVEILDMVGNHPARETEEKRARVQQAYAILSKIVEKKPFFVVTMCTDGEIFDSALDKEKITAPCGNVHMLQCSRHILEPFETAPLYEKMEQQIEAGEVFTALPRCPACGGPLHPNTIRTEGYLQDAYLPSWKTYTTWLSGTLHRRLCVLELGVSFAHPSVIRFPFEKTVFYNKKASLLRVHPTLCQVPQELEGRGMAVAAEPVQFLTELESYL